jgi:hypothetical protein
MDATGTTTVAMKLARIVLRPPRDRSGLGELNTLMITPGSIAGRSPVLSALPDHRRRSTILGHCTPIVIVLPRITVLLDWW